jgi:hypothetical protein
MDQNFIGPLIPSWVLNPGEIPTGKLSETKQLPGVTVKAVRKKKNNKILIYAGLGLLALLLLKNK